MNVSESGRTLSGVTVYGTSVLPGLNQEGTVQEIERYFGKGWGNSGRIIDGVVGITTRIQINDMNRSKSRKIG
ncbi:MAG: hypothetical protein ACE5GH_02350 [Fidelibacterota bacterium]